MTARDLLRRTFTHAAWANEAAVAAVRSAGSPPAALRVLGHLAGAERLWLARLQGVPSPLAVWPALSVDQCGAELGAGATAWAQVLAGLDDAGLAAAVSYTNSQGQPWTSTVGDILAHVVLHGSYHRGQIALALRAAGAEPPYTDFVHAVRTGSI